MVTNTKFDVEKFDGTNNFGMWQCEVQDIIFQQDLDVALEENRPEDVDEKDWTRINRLACGTIRLSLQGAKISVYERDVCKKVVEGDGRQIHEEEHREQALYENKVVPLPV